MNEFLQRWIDEQSAFALSAQDKDNESDLTEQQRVALAFCAGARFDSEMRDGKIVFRSVNRLGFVKIAGMWRVYEDRYGDVVRVGETPSQGTEK